MAVKTWDTSRVGGGTYELQRDATTGNYSLKTVGFDQVNKLNLPDLLTQDATTTTTTKTDTTKTDTTTDTAAPYKQLAQANLGDNTQPDYTGTMVKGGLNERGNIDRTTSMTTGSTGDGPWTMRSEGGITPSDRQPGFETANTQGTTTGDGPWTMRSGKQNQDDSWERGDWKSYAGITDSKERFQGEDKVYKDMDAETASLLPGLSEKDVASVKQPDRFAPGQWGPKPSSGMPTENIKSKSVPFGTDVDKEQGFTADSKALGIDTTASAAGGSQWVKDTISNPNDPNYSGWIQKSVLDKHIADKKAKLAKVSKIPFIGGIARAASTIGDMLPRTWRSTDAQKFNKSYFNLRGGNTGDRRIAGNPANDLYAGMNRTSAYGNLEKSGSKRIATIEKTLSRTNLKESTRKALEERRDKFKEQQKEYRKEKNKHLTKKAVQKGASVSNPAEMHAATGGGDKPDSGRVICTELHRTKEMTTHDWVRDIKFTYNNLSKDHIKGYLFWAIPTVKHIQKYPTYRKIWKHLAQHRANDIAWRLNQGKFDLLGRIYAGIGEPLCWLIGKCVSDKQLKELKLNSWRRA